MKEENNLVKQIKKAETMGTCTNVCTDKTGTLTKNLMQLVSIYIHKKLCRVDADKEYLNEAKIREIIQNCIHKNIGVKEIMEKKDDGTSKLVKTGNKTEFPFYDYLKANHYDYASEIHPVYSLEFSSKWKYMINIYQDEDNADNFTLYIKGAPEFITPMCNKFLVDVDTEEDFDSNKKSLDTAQVEMAKQAMRTLLFGYKKITKDDIENAEKNHPLKDLPFFEELAKGFTFAFMTGSRDEYRPEVPGAVKQCKRGGIVVRMVTGDNIETAVAIAKDVEILSDVEARDTEANKRIKAYLHVGEELEEGQEKIKPETFLPELKKMNVYALEGSVFREICGGLIELKEMNESTGKEEVVGYKLANKDLFINTVKNLKVIGRCSPKDKFILVNGLKELGEVVGIFNNNNCSCHRRRIKRRPRFELRSCRLRHERRNRYRQKCSTYCILSYNSIDPFG